MPDEHPIKALIDKTWIRDRSRSAAEGGVYTLSAPASPSRGGQETLAFRPDGTFSMTGPGPDDRTGMRTGTWQMQGGGKAVLNFDGHDAQATLEIGGPDEIALRSGK